MGCSCRGRNADRFLWYDPADPESNEPMIYNSEVEARAKVMRKGGTYINYNPNLSIGQQIVLAEEASAALRR